MERATQKDERGYYLVGDGIYSDEGTPEKFRGDDVDRLAAYEDTGLEPDDIKRVFNEDAVLNLAGQALGITPDRLRELAQADREGRCVMLPAKTVFELTWDAGPNCNMICPLSIDGKGQCDFCDYGEQFIYESPCRQEHIDQIGKTVFLSREEAEKALEGMKDG